LSAMARIHYEIPDSIHREAKSQAALHGVTLKDYITAAISEKVARDAKRKRG
jgi:predicted HicB family RNase H-like nuclease